MAPKKRARGAFEEKKLAHMNERREEGLSKPISAENKGFKMLKLMGYEEGKGLGKEKGGIVEPLGVTVKSGRCGVGKEGQERRRLQRRVEELKAREKHMLNMRADFRGAMSKDYAYKKLSRDFDKATRLIYTLDERSGIPFNFRWPETEVTAEAIDRYSRPQDGGVDDVTAVEEHTTKQQESKGDTDETEHTTTEELISARINDVETWLSLPLEARVDDVLDYLRREHFYCLYCGCAFDNAEDLGSNCPGLTDEDH